MSISPRTFSNVETLTDPSDARNAPLVVVPWSKFGARRLYVDTADGQHVGWVDLNTGHRSLVMPELAPAFEIAMSEADDAPTEPADADARMPHRALEQAIEFALTAGHASLQACESTPADPPPNRPDAQLKASIAADNRADEHAATMRHAYRGKQAYSSREVGVRGKRLVADELDQPMSLDPRWAYLNSTPVGEHVAEVAHLFA